MHPAFVSRSTSAIPVWFAGTDTLDAVGKKLDSRLRAFATAAGFEAKPGQMLAWPGTGGKVAGILFGIEPAAALSKDLFLPGKLAAQLPPGTYRFANKPHDLRLAALAFALGSYGFTRYRKARERKVQLVLPDGVDGGELERIAEGAALARDLINTPSNDMGPAELESAARRLAKTYEASFRSISRRRAAGEEFSADPRRRRRGDRRNARRG